MRKIVKEFHTVCGYSIEVLRVKPKSFDIFRPSILMLHEGLGSVTMWKDFPLTLAEYTCCEVVAYSRRGYGKSSATKQPRGMDYMHVEALEILPALLKALNLEHPVLLGHSDGASIAIICAGGSKAPLSGLILLAPHVNVEPIAKESISAFKSKWEKTDLHQQLAKYHDDAQSVFYDWSSTWLDPAFSSWNIEKYLPAIEVPVLAIQGFDDEYGTMEQIDAIKRAVPGTAVLKLHNCRHSPHKDQPQKLLEHIRHFLADLPC